jgi:hypothetical protein
MTEEQLRKQWAFVGWMMTGVILGLAGLIASRLLFDLPAVHNPEKPLIPWLLGVPVGGGIVFSVAFLLLVNWYPGAVRIGLYFVYIVTFAVAAFALVVWWALNLFK